VKRYPVVAIFDSEATPFDAQKTKLHHPRTPDVDMINERFDAQTT
jgi:hypothetical protein